MLRLKIGVDSAVRQLGRFNLFLDRLRRQALRRVVEFVQERLRQEVRRALSSWTPSEEAVSRYPFLRDVPAVIEAYTAAIKVSKGEQRGSLRIAVDREELRSKGLPENLAELLEFGNDLIPIFLHWRLTKSWVQEEVPIVARSLAESLKRVYR